MEKAVLFLIFNRPDTTAEVFERIRAARPSRLYVAGDGARPDREGEVERVARARGIATDIDWPCEVKTLFRDENLGCKRAVSGALDWFFEQEEEGIILEDDCVPDPSFFRFCEEMLERYRDNQKIMLISGHNKAGTWIKGGCDHFYSFLGGIWGWASWKRAWRLNDLEMKNFERFRENRGFESLMGRRLGKMRREQMEKAFFSIKEGKVDTWAFPWGFSRHYNGGLACVPSINLIENIGFGCEATHTKSTTFRSPVSSRWVPTGRFPPVLSADIEYDCLFLGGRIPAVVKIRMFFKRCIRLVVNRYFGL